MKPLEQFTCRVLVVLFGLMLSLAQNALAEKQTPVAGKQVMVARYTHTPVVIDGVLDPAEWSAAIPVHVNANKPGTAPGVVPKLDYFPFLFPPDNQDDLSYTVYTMYDKDNLYVAVDVADDFLFSDSPGLPWEDDDVEIFVDGDKQPWDFQFGASCPPGSPCDLRGMGTCGAEEIVVNNEGFQLITSVGGVRMTVPDNPNIVWESRAGLRPRGYLVEVKIPLDSINTLDTSCWTNGVPGRFRRPQPGDTIGFNVAVGDDDNGGASYNRTSPAPRTDSYLAWDGSSNWNLFSEEDWGSLYLLP